MTQYLLALDQGTSSSRALLVDRGARVVARSGATFACHFPHPGWVEADANAIWETQRAAIDGVLSAAGVDLRSIAAIGITNQRETLVAWDKTSGEALAPAIVWQCRRSAPFCNSLEERGKAAWLQARTGLVIDPYFSASKMRWLLDNHPRIATLAERGELAFGTIDAWLIHRLTAGQAHLTDASNASRTQLMDLDRGAWDPALLDLYGIPASTLPRIVDSAGVVAQTDVAFGARIPIAGIAGDQQAALFGQGCVRPGMAKNTYGTGCFMLLHTGQRLHSQHGLLSTLAWQIGGVRSYALEGSVFMAGALVQWLRDGLGLIASSAESEALANAVDDNGGVHVVPAFTGLGAPHWNSSARGLITGLTRGTGRAHIVRAALEAVAWQNADVLRAMIADGASIDALRIDGGMTGNRFLCQFQADALGIPIACAAEPESTALGAALLAGIGIGWWPTPEATAALWRGREHYQPTWTAEQRAAASDAWIAAVRRAL